MLTVTNALKAQAIVLANALLGVLAAFNVGSITDTQKGALLVAVNAVLGLLVAVTYKSSSKRIPDPPVSVVQLPLPKPEPAPPAAPVAPVPPAV